MSNKSSSKPGVANVERRKWDLETYQKKADSRARNEAEDDDNLPLLTTTSSQSKPEFQPAPEGAVGPEGSDRAFLKPRIEKVKGIDDRIGTTSVVSVEAATASSSIAATTATGSKSSDSVVTKTGVGWHCTVCDCFLKDSHTYLDHINGRKHQRKLGYSMRVQRSTEEEIQQRLEALKKKSKEVQEESRIDYGQLVKEKDDLEEKRKEERQRKRKERRKMQKELQKKNESDTDDKSNEEAVVVEEVNPDMASLMGFSGFGG
jgi:U4/U6.U5 tri-snRNP component SNU23